jgi:hypothetical protein
MTISAYIYRFGSTGPSTKSASLAWCRYRARHRLTDAERNNLRDYYRRNPVQSPAIMIAALGAHPCLRRQR